MRNCNDRNRSLLFLRSVTHLGGSERSTLTLIRQLRKLCPVSVLDFYGCCPEYLQLMQDLQIRYHVVMPQARSHIIGGLSLPDRIWQMTRALPEMCQFIRRLRRTLLTLRPRLIWCNDEKAMFTVRRAVGTQFPLAYFVRGQFSRLKWFCLPDWKRLDLIVANNAASLRFFQPYPWARNKLAVAHNGIDFDQVQNTGPPANNLPGLNASFKVIMPATLIPLKAHETVIRSFARLCREVPDALLWICGDTPNNLPRDYENHLRRLTGELNLSDRIHFLGWRSDVTAIMKCAQAMVLASRTEGLPRSILEALALGLPVVATRVGGIPEIIRDDREGLLIDVDDVSALHQALLRLQNPELRRRLGQAGRERVKKQFTIEAQAQKFLDGVQKAICNQRKSPCAPVRW